MAYFADLDPLTYFPVPDPSALRAVGWLTRGEEFTTGTVSAQFFERLCALLISPWQPFATAGAHRCDLCQFSGGPAQMVVGGTTVSLGVTNVFVPGDHCIYVAPSLIAHYVDSHAYSPPPEFIQAVLGCADTRTMEYKKLLISNGARELVRAGF